MSTKAFILFFSLLAATLSLFFISWHKLNQLEKAILESRREKRVFESYILSSFNTTDLHDKVIISEICQPYLNDTSLVIYLPSGLCRACFSSLIFSFQDRDLPGNRVTVISGREDFEVKAECFSRGIHYIVNDLSVESVSDVMLFRLYQGFLPIGMKYNVGRESLLSLFLSDDERLLHVLAGAD